MFSISIDYRIDQFGNSGFFSVIGRSSVTFIYEDLVYSICDVLTCGGDRRGKRTNL